MGCGESFSKVVLIIVNFIFLLASLLMLSLGIAVVLNPDSTLSFAGNFGVHFDVLSDASGGLFASIIKASGIFMIVLGSIVTLIAFFGFFGVCCKSKCMLATYAIIMSVIVMAEVALIIFAAAYPKVFLDKGNDTMYTALKDGFKSDIQINSNGTISNKSLNALDLAWAALQVKVKCCGATGYTDYMNFTWTKCNPNYAQAIIPLSCCKLNDAKEFPQNKDAFSDLVNCQSGSPSSTSANLENGCAQKIIEDVKSFIEKYSGIAIGIAAGIVALEVILIIMSCILCCRSGYDKYR